MELLSGRNRVKSDDSTYPVGMMKAGRVRALAIAAQERLSPHADVPTFAEVGFPGIRAAQWVAAFAPVGGAGRDHPDAAPGVRRGDERPRDAGSLRARRNARPAAIRARGCQGLAQRRNGELEARCPGHRHRRGGMSLKIGILLGDDIGLEVVPECIKVMKAAAARERLDIDWRALPIGKDGHEQHGNTLPAVTEQTLRELDGWVMGPIGHAAYPRGDATWVMPPVRKKFDLFAAVRP